MSDLPPKSISASNFKKFEKNTLQGFVDFTLTASGMVIRECTWHIKDGREWVGFPRKAHPFPGKPILSDGQHAMDATTHKPRYAQIVAFVDRDKGDAIEAIHRLMG